MAQTQIVPEVTERDAGRTRSYTWPDPGPGLERLGRQSGLEILQDMAAGLLPPPPIAHTLGFASFEVEPGRVVVTLEPQEFHDNPLGTMHGGVIAALLDTAAGCAVHTTLPADVGYTSVDLLTKFLRPVTAATGVVRCEGTVLNVGARTAYAEARLTDSRGRLLAHATSTCMLMPLPPARPSA